MNRSFDRSILPMSYLGHLIIEDCLDLSAHGPAACLVHSLTRQKGGMTSSMLSPLPRHLEADSSMSHLLFVAPSGRIVTLGTQVRSCILLISELEHAPI